MIFGLPSWKNQKSHNLRPRTQKVEMMLVQKLKLTFFQQLIKDIGKRWKYDFIIGMKDLVPLNILSIFQLQQYWRKVDKIIMHQSFQGEALSWKGIDNVKLCGMILELSNTSQSIIYAVT